MIGSVLFSAFGKSCRRQRLANDCVLRSLYMQIVMSACVVFMDVCIYCELSILKCRE